MTSFGIQCFPDSLSRLCLISVIIVLQSLISSGITAQMKPDFEADETEVCSGSSVIFSDRSEDVEGNVSYEWDFGNGASPRTASGPGPHTISYSGSGKSTVSLSIERGITVNETKENYINILASPPSPVFRIDCDEDEDDEKEITLEITSPLGDEYQLRLHESSFYRTFRYGRQYMWSRILCN